jgi:hypothetical protein
MTVDWRQVTWYSSVLAVGVFLATFAVAFWLGSQYGALSVLSGRSSFTAPAPGAPGASAPESGAAAEGSGAGSGAASSSPPVAGPLTITAADTGATFTLAPGERFTLALGTALNWSAPAFDPADVVERVPGADPAPGTQGVFAAAAPGETRLTATGAPICDPHEACPQFVELFTATIVVR